VNFKYASVVQWYGAFRGFLRERRNAVSTRLETLLVGRFATPRTGIVTSFGLHAAVILSLLISWAPSHRGSSSDVPIIPVELVTIGDVSNFAPMTREQLPYPEADVAQAPAAPADAAPTFEMKLFPTKPPPPRTAESAVKSASPEGAGKASQATSAPADARIGDYEIKGVGDQTGATLSVLDALRNLIARCWVRPAGRFDAKIAFELYLDRDGSISRPPLRKNEPSGASPAGLNVQAEAIRRAIYTCAPYQLPLSRYDQWHHSVVAFDLSKMGR
jgi:hypothetical protein